MEKRCCCIVGCERDFYALGMCELHWGRANDGKPLVDYKGEHGTADSRFVKFFDVGEKGECWEWKGGISGNGYGLFMDENHKSVSAHRYSFKFHFGAYPEKLVLHKCDNRACVNPNHLEAGDQSKNIKDAIARNRKQVPVRFGESNSRSKLTQEQVNFIKANPQMKHTELARLYGLSPNCIRGVRVGRTWK